MNLTTREAGYESYARCRDDDGRTSDLKTGGRSRPLPEQSVCDDLAFPGPVWTVAATEKINLDEKLERFQSLWDPKIVAQVNDSFLKLVKVQGEYVWHRHDREDELFLALRGQLTVQLRDHDVRLKEGELVVVPKGVEHRPVAGDQAAVLLIEPTTTLNTGNVREARTKEKLDWV